jgi:hypothetical protein
MEKVVRVFRSFEEADAANVEEDLRMTPEQRIEIVFALRDRVYPNASEQGFERVCRVVEREED